MQPEDDPWAPLPPEPELRPEPGPAPASKPLSQAAAQVPAPSVRPPAAPNPEGERLLAELQQRLRAASKSQGDPLGRAVARASRRLHAAEAPARLPPVAAAPTGSPAGSPAEASGPPVVAVDYESDRDPREDEPWFRELSPDEQQRLRESWHGDRHRFEDHWQIARRRFVRACWQGGVVFFVLAVLQAPLVGAGAIVPLTVAGVLAGVCGQAGGGGRFLFGLAGTIAFLVVMGPSLLLSPLGMMSSMIAAFGMAALGLDREMRQSGGFRDNG